MNKYDRYPSLRLYDRLGVPYVLTSEKWGGPLWTGHCMVLSTRERLADETFLHELMHWIEASPAQRRFPDFALGRWVNADPTCTAEFATSTTSDYFHATEAPSESYPQEERNVGWGEKTISLKQAHAQEASACNGMFFYHVLVGNTTWSNPLPAAAAWEFSGAFPPPASVVAKTASRIIATLASRPVSYDTVKRYADSVLELDNYDEDS